MKFSHDQRNKTRGKKRKEWNNDENWKKKEKR